MLTETLAVAEAVGVPPNRMASAWRILASLPADARRSRHACVQTLIDQVDVDGATEAAALCARAEALTRWIDGGRDRAVDPVVIEAAATCPLALGVGGRFDEAAFADLVEFVADLPWPHPEGA